MRHNILFLLLAILLAPLSVNAQLCGFDQLHHQLLTQDPAFAQKVQEINANAQAYVQSNPNALIVNTPNGPVYQVPVVIHVIHTGGAVGSVYNPTAAQLTGMIAYLNQAYSATFPSYPNATSGGTFIPLQFVLAQRDPNCGATNGINRVNGSSVTGYASGGIDLGSGTGVAELSVKDLSRWPNKEYYNIWVVNKINGADGTVPGIPFIAGYAYFPGAPATIDGTVMLATQATSGAITLPHEVGHAFSVLHTFEGDNNGTTCPVNNNCVTDGDLVCDTDPHIMSPFNCPTGTNSCTGLPVGNVVHNFMDYSNCQDRFTPGQSARIMSTLTGNSVRSSLISSLGGTPPATLPPVCIPTITNPANFNNAGPRDIRITDASLTYMFVTSGGYNTDGNQVYIDNSCKHEAVLTSGNTYTFSVKTGANTENVKIFVDYNNNGTFSAAEQIFSHAGTLSNEVHSFSFTVPTTATVPSLLLNQHLRMRVISDRTTAPAISACGPLGFGQAEDYSIMITTGIATPVVTSVPPVLCQASPADIVFTASGSYAAGNVFTAELSNASGSFNIPVAIGTLASTTGGVISATIPTNQAAGTGYRVRVTSSNPAGTGADNGTNLIVSLRPTTAQVALSPAGNPSICAGGSVALSVPATAGFTYQWKSGAANIAGATSNSFNATAAGSYKVEVTNAAGCSRVSASKTVTVIASPAATISPNTPQTICAGQSIVFNANTGGGLLYQWFKNNVQIAGATTSSFTASVAGSYSVQVTNASGCTTISSSIAVTSGSCSATISDAGTRAVCQGGNVTVSFTATGFNAGNIFTLQLSNINGGFGGAQNIGTLASTTGGSISGIIPAATPTGSGYKLRIKSSNPATTGAASLLTLNVQSALPGAFEICAVTVDSASGKNLVVWNKPVSTNIDSFVVYRNTSTAGSFARLGAQPYSALSTFLDNTSEPKVSAQYYLLKAKNSCGESLPGAVHKTMHLTINKGQNNTTWNLIWNGYEGFPHGRYSIWRGTNATNMTIIKEQPAASFNSFSDFGAPTGTLLYKVTIGDGPNCTPTVRTTEDYMVASNIATNAEGVIMELFPNPATSASYVRLLGGVTTEVYSIRVVDVAGRLIDLFTLSGDEQTAFGEKLSRGMYIIEASKGKERVAVAKWVKE